MNVSKLGCIHLSHELKEVSKHKVNVWLPLLLFIFSLLKPHCITVVLLFLKQDA